MLLHLRTRKLPTKKENLAHEVCKLLLSNCPFSNGWKFLLGFLHPHYNLREQVFWVKIFHLIRLVYILHRRRVLLCYNLLLDFLPKSLEYVVLRVGWERHLMIRQLLRSTIGLSSKVEWKWKWPQKCWKSEISLHQIKSDVYLWQGVRMSLGTSPSQYTKVRLG